MDNDPLQPHYNDGDIVFSKPSFAQAARIVRLVDPMWSERDNKWTYGEGFINDDLQASGYHFSISADDVVEPTDISDIVKLEKLRALDEYRKAEKQYFEAKEKYDKFVSMSKDIGELLRRHIKTGEDNGLG